MSPNCQCPGWEKYAFIFLTNERLKMEVLRTTSFVFQKIKTNMAVSTKRDSQEFVPFPVGVNNDYTTHYLFVKQHKTREVNELKPQDKTVFVINVPPYFTEDCMRSLFSSYGDIENVFFHEKPTASAPSAEDMESKYFPRHEAIKGYKVSFVVFRKKSSLTKLLKSDPDVVHPLSLEENGVVLGLEKWCREYRDNIVNVKELSDEIETYMADYDRKAEEEIAKAKEQGADPDDEGWITVNRHIHKSVIPRTEAANKKILSKEKKRRSQKALLNFYSFQIRESKMEHLAQLRKKFQEDKARIAAMKASRKFKPC